MESDGAPETETAAGGASFSSEASTTMFPPGLSMSVLCHVVNPFFITVIL